MLTAAVALAGFIAFYARDLPDTGSLWETDGGPATTLLALDGSPLPVHGESRGAPVRLSSLPPYVSQAVLAVEDRNFSHHVGVNPLSVVRALIVNARAGEVVQGGSTITQQLAKNLFLSPDRTMKRKIQELLLALWLEQRFTKDEILTIYLNRVYFGGGAYGIDAASYRYFGKPAQNLTIGEAAVLAGLLKAPSRYSPTNNPADAGARARLVIDAMQDAGFLRPLAAARAKAQPVRLSPPPFSVAPYMIDHMMRETRALTSSVDADLIVQTTFDRRLQTALEQGVAAGLLLSPPPQGAQVAAIIMDAEGAVRAMIGGVNYGESQFNRATQARRQVGSTFKPFVYLAALEAGLEPGDLVLDAPVTVERWTPDNYNDRFYGEVTLSEALAQSLNSAAVRLQETVGRNAVSIQARKMGMESSAARGPALALGVDAASPLELITAYAPLVNGGYRVTAHSVESIRTADGVRLYRRERGLGPATASFHSISALNQMLQEVVDHGTGKAAQLPGRRAAGKTGTSQGGRDLWFAGHAGGLLAVVWVGRDDNAPIPGASGGGSPAAIWREVMIRALGSSPEPIVAPAQSPGREHLPQGRDPLTELLSGAT